MQYSLLTPDLRINGSKAKQVFIECAGGSRNALYELQPRPRRKLGRHLPNLRPSFKGFWRFSPCSIQRTDDTIDETDSNSWPTVFQSSLSPEAECHGTRRQASILLIFRMHLREPRHSQHRELAYRLQDGVISPSSLDFRIARSS